MWYRFKTKWWTWRAARRADVGTGCLIEGARLHVPRHVHIGDRVTILRDSEIVGHAGKPVVIGDDCFISQRCLIREGVTLGNRVSLAPCVVLMSCTHEQGPPGNPVGAPLIEPITISDGAALGCGVIVLGGVTIGPGCVVAAGSLVSTDCDANWLYFGSPARRVRSLIDDPAIGPGAIMKDL